MNSELRDRLLTAVPALVALLERNHQQTIELRSIVDSNAALIASITDRSTSLDSRVQLLSDEVLTAQKALTVAMDGEKASLEEVATQKAYNEALDAKIAEMNAIDKEQVAAIEATQLAADEAIAKLATLMDESNIDDAKIGDLLDTVQASIEANQGD